jgi:hypothetical protein
MITNFKEYDDTLFCQQCLEENIPKPHYHVTMINLINYCPIHNDLCNYCNSPNHSTKRCPFVKIRILSTSCHKEEYIFQGKIRKNSNYRLISKKKSQEKNEKVIDIVEQLSKMVINRKNKVTWFDDNHDEVK